MKASEWKSHQYIILAKVVYKIEACHFIVIGKGQEAGLETRAGTHTQRYYLSSSSNRLSRIKGTDSQTDRDTAPCFSPKKRRTTEVRSSQLRAHLPFEYIQRC